MRISDWSSDVCSSNLIHPEQRKRVEARDLTVRPQLHAIEDDSRSRSFGGHIESAGAKAQPPNLPIIGAGAAVLDIEAARSEERREGKECGSTCILRWPQSH